MTRVKISAFILSAILALSVISGIYVNKNCGKLLELSASVQESLDSGSKAEALEKAEIFCENWQDFRKWADIMLKNDKLCEISRIASRIIPMIEAGSDEADADIEEITEMIKMLRKSEEPFIMSIL